jgi:hypothetical protein
MNCMKMYQELLINKLEEIYGFLLLLNNFCLIWVAIRQYRNNLILKLMLCPQIRINLQNIKKERGTICRKMNISKGFTKRSMSRNIMIVILCYLADILFWVLRVTFSISCLISKCICWLTSRIRGSCCFKVIGYQYHYNCKLWNKWFHWSRTLLRIRICF